MVVYYISRNMDQMCSHQNEVYFIKLNTDCFYLCSPSHPTDTAGGEGGFWEG